MKTKALIGAIAAWAILSSILIIPLVSGCSNIRKSNIVEDLSDDGQLLNDDLVAYRSGDGKVSIKNSVTGEVTIKDLQIDWTQRSRNDSIAVFCSEGKRGYYNAYTGEIVVPAQYRRAWIFSDGLAAVQKNGNIGFIDHQGRVVIDFLFPFHGNPLSDFVFEDGHCVVADNNGKCGVIDTKGRWLIKPDYEYVTACRDYAIVTNSGAKMQVGYDGHIINSFVIDYLRELTYTCQERSVTPDGSVCYIDKTVSTGLFSYSVGGRCGLMDSNCNRLTEPIYTYLNAENDKVLKATLLDGASDVIINTKGEVMK